MQTAASGATSQRKKPHIWPIALVNVLLAAVLSFGHAAKSRVLFKWRFLVDFDGEQPFQSRVLTFMIANGIDRLHHLGDRGLALLFMAMDFTATVIAFIFVWKAWAALDNRKGSLLTVLFLFWWQLFATFVVSGYNNFYYPYDMSSLAFMAMGLWMIVSKRHWLMLLALCIPAMMNRETAILLPFFYLAFHWPAWRTVWRQFLALLVASVAVKLVIAAALNASSDDMVSLYHVPGFLRLYYNFAFIWLGPEYRGTANVFFAFGFAWVLLFMRGQTDTRLHQMMLCFIPFFLGMMVVGNLSEIRIFAEFIPLMALLLASKLTNEVKPAG